MLLANCSSQPGTPDSMGIIRSFRVTKSGSVNEFVVRCA